jgi:flagellar protein FliS
MNAGLSYREAAVRGASPLGLVVLLYEQLIEDLRRALAALRRGDIETRTRGISHALLVLGHLQASLNMDQGGQVAVNLEQFYKQVSTGLIEAQCRQSATMLEQQISHLLLVRDAWCEVERASTARPSGAPSVAQSPATSGAASSGEWNA